MSSVRLTSIQTYNRIKDSGLVSKMQDMVYVALLNNPSSCDRDIAEFLGLRICSVTPRRGELVRMGLVEESGKEDRYYSEGGKQVKSNVCVFKAIKETDVAIVQEFHEKRRAKKKKFVSDKEKVIGDKAYRFIGSDNFTTTLMKTILYFNQFPAARFNTKVEQIDDVRADSGFRKGYDMFKVKISRDII